METIDPALAQQVWQRVRGDMPPADSPDLIDLMERELEDASRYLHLSRFFSPEYSRLLRQMHQQERSHAACLKGIYRMMTGKRPAPRLPKVLPEKPADALRRCYDRETQCVRCYEAHAADPRYGHTFARMALQEKEHCRILSELLGRLER